MVRDFTRGTRHHQTLSKCIYVANLELSRRLLIQKGFIVDRAWTYLPFVAGVQKELHEYERVPQFKYVVGNPFAAESTSETLLWTHSVCSRIENAQDYSYFIAVWLRVNCGATLLQSSNAFYLKNVYTRHKCERFCNNHLRLVQYLDSLEDPSDANIDINRFLALYSSLGASRYSEDRGDIEVVDQMVLSTRALPIVSIEQAYPHLEWNPEEIPLEAYVERDDFEYDPLRATIRDVHLYKLYAGCVVVVQQLLDAMQEEPIESLRDSLYYYYVAFADLFYHCLSVETKDMSDQYLTTYLKTAIGITTWDAYSPYYTSNRAFHAGDLPDFFKTLCDIPLKGDQHKPSFLMAKVLQKCLPFCGQRRKLVEVITSNNVRHDAFWYVVSKVFWCMLAGMYPGDTKRPTMRQLMRIKEMTDVLHGRDEFNKIIKYGEYDGSAFIVYTAFRRYILYMAQDNAHYEEQAQRCIDWVEFRRDTLERAEIIRQSHRVYPADAFGRARVLLNKMHTNSSNLQVYRYQKHTRIESIMYYCREMLQKTIFQSLQDWKRDRKCLTKIKAELAKGSQEMDVREISSKSILWDIFKDLSVDVSECVAKAEQLIGWHMEQLSRDIPQVKKEAILNLVIRLPVNKRMSADSFHALRLLEYGGVSDQVPEIMQKLVEVYDEAPAPRKYNAQLKRLYVYDFKVVCWYFNVVSVLENIHFALCDADWVRNGDEAMRTKRYTLFEGQRVPPAAYEVILTLCCGRVNTLKGFAAFGNKEVAYDLTQQTFVCSKKKGNKRDTDPLDDMSTYQVVQDYVEARKTLRNQRKLFTNIPCKGQPVMKINLRGFHLIYGHDRDQKVRYCHCPACGAFHVYKWTNWAFSDHNGRYRCGQCIENDVLADVVYECSYCLARPKKKITKFEALRLSLYVFDAEPLFYNTVYFCRKHYNIAKGVYYKLKKADLWTYIHRVEQKRMIHAAMNYH